MHSLVWIHTGRIRHCQSIYLEEQNNSLTWKSLNNYSKQDGTERFGDYRRINSITAWQIYIKWNAIILKLAVPYVCRFLCYIFRTKNFKLHKSIPQEPLFVAILSFIAKRYFTSVLKMRESQHLLSFAPNAIQVPITSTVYPGQGPSSVFTNTAIRFWRICT